MKMFLVFLGLSLMLVACNNENDHTAFLEVRLTDAPGDYEAVNVDIQGVEIHTSEEETESGWKSLDIEKGTYDLLKLTNGLDTLLATGEFPAGKISQIRLILGDNNTVKINGEELMLSTPSAQQSGLKLKVNAVLTEGITYVILLDFDAAQSIVKTGNNSYKLKPVIRSIVNAESGAVKGIVSPIESSPAIYAIMGSDTLATTNIAGNGAFLLRGLPAGTYNITFEPSEGFQPQQKTDVSVAVGSATDVGLITIPQ